MQSVPDLSTIAGLIGDPTRATILWTLLDGQSLPATELARRAHITAQTMSTHLAKLVEGGLLEVNRIGRHRYYRIKNAEVAHALEALSTIAPPPQFKPKRESEETRALTFARTCYDHLAGKLGVMLTQTLLDSDVIVLDEKAYRLTEQGSRWLATWNIDERQLRKSRRIFACPCLDWSERREHLAGALGAAITAQLFERGWIMRIPGKRALRLTAAGRSGFQQEFGLVIKDV
ncbi:MAG TPA: winged helix-turn-helix domain-containing protein [Oceanobacillus sp.]|nr:winged helix-turn-helix domain-containing protein [Oceanobacillus sp.]